MEAQENTMNTWVKTEPIVSKFIKFNIYFVSYKLPFYRKRGEVVAKRRVGG